MRRTTIALALCALGLSGCGGGGGGTSTTDVGKLVSNASRLKIDSLAFTLQTTVPGTGGGAPTTLHGTARLQLRPTLAGELNFDTGGKATVERIIGNSIYVYLPSIAAHDGGRPWVAVDLKTASAASGIDVGALLAQAKNADPSSTLRLLAARKLFHTAGTSTIDGQHVVALTGSFTPATLTSPELSPALLAQLKAKLAQIGATHETVTTYLADSGQPVRIVTTVTTSTHGTIASTIDFHAINVPVSVTPPPAAQTVTLAEASKL